MHALVYGFIFLHLSVQVFLELLNRTKIKNALLSKENLDEKYVKSLHYTNAKSSLRLVEIFFDGVLLFTIYYFSILPAIFHFFHEGLWYQVAFVLFCVLSYGFLKLIFSYVGTFSIESKYGFNNSTVALWVADQLKGVAIALILGALVLYGLFYLIQVVAYWWLWGVLLLFAFQLLMMVLVPIFIMPMFNKYEPLEDGELKNRLLALAQKTGFGCQSIQKVDGSKRSNHSNAYFTGFGKFRKIVIFDTLLKQLSDKELEAVLAHEIGHYKLGHIPRMILLSLISLGLSFATIALLLQSEYFYQLFGFSENSVGLPAPLFIVLIFFSNLITFWWSPISNALSRAWEYQADGFAKNACGGGENLVSALEVLSRENLSNPIPHFVYSFFYYSHPVLVERKAALQN